ncbi:MAG: hypothetical protein P8Y64_14110 [Gammaproteobacteria bacterium]|jgi:hypothetical protein
MSYRHTQVATVLLVVLGAGLLAALYAAARTHWSPVMLVVLAVLAGVVLLFHSLTIEQEGRWLIARFGSGPIRFRFDLDEVVSAKPVRNRWWYGWGIHLTPDGWLYNVSGLEAVELVFGSGRRVRLGTDEPARLAAVVNNHAHAS